MLKLRSWRAPQYALRRQLTTSPPRLSGHNRWSKIKHDKAKTDASISNRNSILSKELTRLSKTGGPDPTSNAALANMIASARKQRFPKSSIENAIARGQGRSTSGAPLESVTVEAMLPGGVAAIIECQTDSKIRTITAIRTMINKAEGGQAPTLHLFQKKGRVVCVNEAALSATEVLDIAIDSGAEDVEISEEEGQIEVWCEPKETSRVSKEMVGRGMKCESADIVWVANEDTKVDGPEDADSLENLVEKIEDDPGVTDVYLNIREERQ